MSVGYDAPCVDGPPLERAFERSAERSVRPCVRPIGAARMAAGYNAFREVGSRPRARAQRRSGANGFSRSSVRPAGCV